MDKLRKSRKIIMALQNYELDLENWPSLDLEGLEFFAYNNNAEQSLPSPQSLTLSAKNDNPSSLGLDVQDWDTQILESLKLDLTTNDPYDYEVMDTGKVGPQNLSPSPFERRLDLMDSISKNSLAMSVTSDDSSSCLPHNSSIIMMTPPSTAPSSPSALNEEYQSQVLDAPFDYASLVDECSSNEDSVSTGNDVELDNTSAMEIFDNILASLSTCEYTVESEPQQTVTSPPQAQVEQVVTVQQRPRRSGVKRTRESIDSEDSLAASDHSWDPSSPESSCSKPKRKQRRGALPPEVRKERKKNQNKNAANRYRLKKRQEQELVESAEGEQIRKRDELNKQLEKIEMEFKVLIPLATAAFRNDPVKSLQLLQVQTNIAKLNLV